MPLTVFTGRQRQIAGEVFCIAVLISLCLAIGLPRFRSGIDHAWTRVFWLTARSR